MRPDWPLYQITAKVGPALAAGCTVVLKPSELSPLSALLFAEVMRDAGVPTGGFNLVNGDGPEVGAAMAMHPDVDMISITGSTRAGILVAQAAAVTVKRVAQELGGKSPNLILPDADLARAVPAGVAAAFRNVGQSCSAPTGMIVPRERLADIERIACDAVSGIVVGDPRSPQTTHGPVANRAQFNRVQEMIGAGIAVGARLVCGGLGVEGLQEYLETKAIRCRELSPHRDHPGPIARAIRVLRRRMRWTDEARPHPAARRRRLQAVRSASGRRIAGPGSGML